MSTNTKFTDRPTNYYFLKQPNHYFNQNSNWNAQRNLISHEICNQDEVENSEETNHEQQLDFMPEDLKRHNETSD